LPPQLGCIMALRQRLGRVRTSRNQAQLRVARRQLERQDRPAQAPWQLTIVIARHCHVGNHRRCQRGHRNGAPRKDASFNSDRHRHTFLPALRIAVDS
jgi:hypothetical protein